MYGVPRKSSMVNWTSRFCGPKRTTFYITAKSSQYLILNNRTEISRNFLRNLHMMYPLLVISGTEHNSESYTFVYVLFDQAWFPMLVRSELQTATIKTKWAACTRYDPTLQPQCFRNITGHVVGAQSSHIADCQEPAMVLVNDNGQETEEERDTLR